MNALNYVKRAQFIVILAVDRGCGDESCVVKMIGLLENPAFGIRSWWEFLDARGREIETMLVARGFMKREDSWL